jgi:hypothetical protein
MQHAAVRTSPMLHSKTCDAFRSLPPSENFARFQAEVDVRLSDHPSLPLPRFNRPRASSPKRAVLILESFGIARENHNSYLRMQDNLRRVAELDELSGDCSKRVTVALFIKLHKIEAGRPSRAALPAVPGNSNSMRNSPRLTCGADVSRWSCL